MVLSGLLLKVGSADAAVRTRTLGILSHVNKRLKACPTVQLPVAELVRQLWVARGWPSLEREYANATATAKNTAVAMVKNVTLVYLEMGLPRAPLEVQLYIIIISLLYYLNVILYTTCM